MKVRLRDFVVRMSVTTIVLASGLYCATAGAQTVYKTIDAQGNVSFSSTPPPPGTQAQEIELSPGPTRAEQRKSIQQERKLEAQSNAIPDEEPEPSPADEDENVAEPSTEYHEESADYQDYDQPVVDDGYVDEPYRDERVRDDVDNVPAPGEVRHPAARGR